MLTNRYSSKPPCIANFFPERMLNLNCFLKHSLLIKGHFISYCLWIVQKTQTCNLAKVSTNLTFPWSMRSETDCDFNFFFCDLIKEIRAFQSADEVASLPWPAKHIPWKKKIIKNDGTRNCSSIHITLGEWASCSVRPKGHGQRSCSMDVFPAKCTIRQSLIFVILDKFQPHPDTHEGEPFRKAKHDRTFPLENALSEIKLPLVQQRLCLSAALFSSPHGWPHGQTSSRASSMPGELEKDFLVSTWGSLLCRNKIQSSTFLFFHHSFQLSSQVFDWKNIWENKAGLLNINQFLVSGLFFSYLFWCQTRQSTSSGKLVM